MTLDQELWGFLRKFKCYNRQLITETYYSPDFTWTINAYMRHMHDSKKLFCLKIGLSYSSWDSDQNSLYQLNRIFCVKSQNGTAYYHKVFLSPKSVRHLNIYDAYGTMEEYGFQTMSSIISAHFVTSNNALRRAWCSNSYLQCLKRRQALKSISLHIRNIVVINGPVKGWMPKVQLQY